MAGKTKNIADSVRQRLLNKARESSRPFNELLQHFAIERFIYRLSKSPYANRFVLKGALMFSAWTGSMSRPTREIDLLGKTVNSLESIMNLVKDVCEMEVENDGVVFDKDTVSATRITEAADYKGARVSLRGNLGSIRLLIQVDIGFGDVIVPKPSRVSYPVLLDFPAPILNGYTMESTIAEKFQAMVKLGLLNSRMKDFYDIWLLSRSFDFKGEILREALEETFKKRNTLVINEPTIFDASFINDGNKQSQWMGFIDRVKLDGASTSLSNVATDIKVFLQPVIVAIINRQTFKPFWKAPGPWNS